MRIFAQLGRETFVDRGQVFTEQPRFPGPLRQKKCLGPAKHEGGGVVLGLFQRGQLPDDAGDHVLVELDPETRHPEPRAIDAD